MLEKLKADVIVEGYINDPLGVAGMKALSKYCWVHIDSLTFDFSLIRSKLLFFVRF